MKYTFGTSRIAARRLYDISRYFNPLALDLIRTHAPHPVSIAFDLGCGPGFTTSMLASAVMSAKTYGADNSREFLRLARKRFPSCCFLEFDICKTPFPVIPNVIYVRFVLSHLASPVKMINQWMRELAPGGLMFVEEVEKIETEVESFASYLKVNDAIVREGGASLFVGEELSAGNYNADVLINESVSLPVCDRQAATWFLPNVKTIWKHNPCVSNLLGTQEIKAISKELGCLVNSRSEQSRITWNMRRLVLRAASRESG